MSHARLLPPTGLQHISSEKTDDRRNKRYNRKLKLFAASLLEDDEYSKPVAWPEQQLGHAFREAFPDNPIRVHCSYMQASYLRDGDPARLSMSVTVKFKADKPSLVPSEEECYALLGGDDGVLPLFKAAVAAAQLEFDFKMAREQIAEEAGSLAHHLAKRIIEASDASMRYLQRRDALRAERKTEIAVHKKAHLAEYIKEARESWDEDEEWFQVVLAHADTLLDGRLKTNALPKMFRGNPRDGIRGKDIELPEDFLPRPCVKEEEVVDSETPTENAA